MSWQPIKTCPRDGTRVIFYDAAKDVIVGGHWHDDPGIDNPNAYEPAWSWWVSDDDMVMWDGDETEIPTHWMPFEKPQP